MEEMNREEILEEDVVEKKTKKWVKPAIVFTTAIIAIGCSKYNKLAIDHAYNRGYRNCCVDSLHAFKDILQDQSKR